jgi:hypothetical protein
MEQSSINPLPVLPINQSSCQLKMRGKDAIQTDQTCLLLDRRGDDKELA